MAKLTAAARKKIPAKDFALGKGRYPIEDASHARNALARVSQHGTPAEKAKVRAAVHGKYPAIGKDGRHMGAHESGKHISRQLNKNLKDEGETHGNSATRKPRTAKQRGRTCLQLYPSEPGTAHSSRTPGNEGDSSKPRTASNRTAINEGAAGNPGQAAGRYGGQRWAPHGRAHTAWGGG